jgi:hypothetical protein
VGKIKGEGKDIKIINWTDYDKLMHQEKTQGGVEKGIT